jgi:aminomethyltransferase
MTEVLRESPFADRRPAVDGAYIDVNGYSAALAITDPLDEYRAVRERVGMFDFSPLVKVDVRGRGALAAVDAAVVRDLTGVPPGRVAYSPVVNDAGGMLDDSTCFVFGPDRVRVVGGLDMPAAIDAATAGKDLVVRPLREDICHLTLQGPRSRELLAKLVEVDVSNEAFPYYTFRDEVSVAGIPCLLARMGFTAELGYEIQGPVDRALELWDAVAEAGKEFDIRSVGSAALMVCRIEAGMVIAHLDYDETVTPWECNLGWAVNLDTGAYRGRDALAASRDTAPTRLVSVRLEGGERRATGAPLFRDDEQVGHVTMSVVSPYLDFATLGLARVAREHAAVGSRLVARLEEGEVAGEVVPMPVYDPERKRVHS